MAVAREIEDTLIVLPFRVGGLSEAGPRQVLATWPILLGASLVGNTFFGTDLICILDALPERIARPYARVR